MTHYEFALYLHLPGIIAKMFLMVQKTTDITLLCKVIDNYGDIGTVYRLARALEELNQSHECAPVSLRLVTDNLESFHSIEPAVKTNVPFQILNSIKIYDWNAFEFCHNEFIKNPPEIILECFQCGRPDWLEKLLFDEGCPDIVHIIMIDYLTAEEYADTFHCLMSLTRSARVEKINFMPGFTSKTGGVVLDKAFMKSLKIDSTNVTNGSTKQNEFNIVFFTYEKDWTPAVKALAGFKKGNLNVLVAKGRGHDSFIEAWEKCGKPFKVCNLDFLQQSQWDAMLCKTPLLFIRGEDSLSRACLTGNPFIWHAYPQTDEYQTVKVKALLERMRPFFGEQLFTCVENVFIAFNTPDGNIEESLKEFLRNYDNLCSGFKKFALNLQKNGNFAKNLMTFIEKTYKINML